jgi:hypothetical protein
MTTPNQPSADSLRAAQKIVDYIALPDSAEPDDSTGSPTEYIARIIDECAPVPPVPDEKVKEIRAWLNRPTANADAYAQWSQGRIYVSLLLESLRAAPAVDVAERIVKRVSAQAGVLLAAVRNRDKKVLAEFAAIVREELATPSPDVEPQELFCVVRLN